MDSTRPILSLLAKQSSSDLLLDSVVLYVRTLPKCALSRLNKVDPRQLDWGPQQPKCIYKGYIVRTRLHSAARLEIEANKRKRDYVTFTGPSQVCGDYRFGLVPVHRQTSPSERQLQFFKTAQRNTKGRNIQIFYFSTFWGSQSYLSHYLQCTLHKQQQCTRTHKLYTVCKSLV